MALTDALLLDPFPLARSCSVSGCSSAFAPRLAPHNLKAGMVVFIRGARINQAPSAVYDSEFKVEKLDAPSDPQDKVFFYRMASDPGQDADPSISNSPVQFGALWQTSHYVLEHNLIDFYGTDIDTPLAPRGSTLLHLQTSGPFVYPQWVVRENIVRHVDQTASTPNMLGQTAAGFQADGVEYGLIEQNIIDAEDAYPIHRFIVKSVRCFGNRSGSGRLIRSADLTSGVRLNPRSELEDLIEGATILAFY